MNKEAIMEKKENTMHCNGGGGGMHAGGGRINGPRETKVTGGQQNRPMGVEDKGYGQRHHTSWTESIT